MKLFFKKVGNTDSLFSSIEVLFEESMAICQRFSKNSAFTKEGEELKDNRKCGCTTSISFTLQFYRERDYIRPSLKNIDVEMYSGLEKCIKKPISEKKKN